MILALDIGNSRAKWGLHTGSQWTARGALPNDRLATLAQALPPGTPVSRLIASNVAGPAAREAASQALAPLGVPVTWISASTECGGVRNGYRNPEQLGSDRWAALVAARACLSGPCVVANAGTALTVDALASDGQFLGGLIVPGLRMLETATANVLPGLTDATGTATPFPGNTADALYNGRLAAMAGSIILMHQRLSTKETASPACILSGGDAILIAPLLPFPVSIVETLVLDGLIKIAQS